MTVPSSPSLYNQYTLGDDDFVANFVARHPVLELLLRRFRVAEPDGDGVHHILIGPRGMGKTSLLRRLAIAINRDAELSAKYIPLSFREEQYNVLSVGDFWRNCGEALAEWAEGSGRAELAYRIDAALPTDAWMNDQHSAEAFKAEMNGLERRAVLLVDNLDLILGALTGDAQWTLRRYLQERHGPIMIGAATQPLKESADRSAAFYQFFQPHHLEPLDEHDTEQCMRALALRRGERGRHVIEVLNTRPERLKTLHTLTGGNPRVLALIYRLLETAESEAAMSDLEILLDQVTPYYKARIEEYQTSQQRAVIDAIALNWDPITTGDLSRTTNIVSTTLSPLLIKLRKDGLIESVETSGAYAAHQIVERFLNIWYLMRHGTRRTKQRMRWLVEFLASFFSSRELAEIARNAESQGIRKRWSPEYGAAFEEALGRDTLGMHVRMRRRRVRTTPLSARVIDNPVDEPELIPSDPRVVEADGLLQSAWEYFSTGSFSQCLTHLDELIARYADHPALREQVASALLNKGFTLSQMGDNEAAIAVYDVLFARYADAEELAVREQVAEALLLKGVTLGQMSNNEAEIAAYDVLVARFADAKELAVRELVATALFFKGVRLGLMSNNETEIAAYDVLLARFADAKELAVRELVAKALLFKGSTLGQMGNNAAEIAAYDDLLTRFADAEESAVREQVARALLFKGITLGQLSDNEAAISTFELALKHGEGEVNGTLASLMATTQIRLANLLFDLRGDVERAEMLYKQALDLEPVFTKGNLIWVYLQTNRVSEASGLRNQLDGLPASGIALIDAGVELARDNFGSAVDHFAAALVGELETTGWSFTDNLNRLLRLASHRGYDERLIQWFEETGFADRVAPVFLAFKAYVRGEAVLLDANPEVRQTARLLFDRLDAPRRYQSKAASHIVAPKRTRGRPRKV